MKKAITISIPNPCHEDWAQMTPVEKGRQCAVCDTLVVDFTNMTNEQLYKTATSGTKICGRLKNSQLETPISIKRKKYYSLRNIAATLLIPTAILSTQEVKAQGKPVITELSEKTYTSLDISSLSRKQTLQENDSFLIKGSINSEYGSVPYTSITIKGTTRHTQADIDGNYEIIVKKGEILVFDSLGFELQEITVKTKKIINVYLKGSPIIMLGKILIKEKTK